jgi:hypothetical protein
MEVNKEERINSIKEYIQKMVDESVTSQVKADLIAGRTAWRNSMPRRTVARR